jgi:hypothetical protein
VRLGLGHVRARHRGVDLGAVGQRLVPAAHGVVVVGAGVDDLVLAVVLRPVRPLRVVGIEPPLEDRHAGQPEPLPQPLDGRGDDPEVLRDQRQIAVERPRGRVERRAAGSAPPPPGQRVARSPGHRPVGDEAAEVVDPRDVVQLEDAPEALGPPAVAAAPQCRPVVQRVAPQLALVGVGVRRRARHRVVHEQRRVRPVVDRARRDVDRHVADQAHAALRGVLPQRGPLAVEPHLVGHRAARAEPRPVLDPERLALAERDLLLPRDRRPRVRQQPGPGRERRRRLVRGAVAVRWPQGQHLPPRLARVGQPVDERVGLLTEPPAGQ